MLLSFRIFRFEFVLSRSVHILSFSVLWPGRTSSHVRRIPGKTELCRHSKDEDVRKEALVVHHILTLYTNDSLSDVIS